MGDEGLRAKGCLFNLYSADIVEYKPARNINDITAMVAPKPWKEINGKLLLDSSWKYL